jgi:hypothetical protein
MSCDVYVYDNSLAPVKSTYIEIIEKDHWGVNIDRKTSAKLGPSEYGAKLKAPNPAEPINVFVDDTKGKYAPAALGDLNGRLSARLDVTLYPLPVPVTGGGGGGGGGGRKTQSRTGSGGGHRPSAPRAIAAYIQAKVDQQVWSEEEAQGVRSLVEVVSQAINLPRWERDEQPRLDRWCATLDDLGIEIPATEGGSHHDPEGARWELPRSKDLGMQQGGQAGYLEI